MQPEGVKGAIADFVCFHAPLSRPQARFSLQQEKSSNMEADAKRRYPMRK